MQTRKRKEDYLIMSEQFGADYISLTDEEGNEFELEILDVVSFEGESYTVFLPADIDEMDPNDPDYGFVILKNVEDQGEELYASVDDEELLERVYEYYMELVENAEDEE